MDALREGLYRSWERCGQQKPPLLELVKLEASSVKFYLVDDGVGGGAVFTDNASAQEYLHLEEDWSTIEAASRPTDSSLQTWLSPEEVKELQQQSSLTFTDEYLQNEQCKFTGLAYVTTLRSAPWVKPALMLLEKRLHSPAAIVEQVREAHVARRSEHTDEEMIDTRALDRCRRRWGQAAAVDPVEEAPSDYRPCPPGRGIGASGGHTPPHSLCNEQTEEFHRHTQGVRKRFQGGRPDEAGRRPY
ncbi:hypothetical protein CYMTET_7526 [Cymbomonas tetramitiformis]|uniref:Uncharacterized protein n=1 Tax=Cymbomonas tetramitiformis TaxID=36881 RepID=A0AAE0GVH9_9CHLO|nr:hypothetical protein CYMTET_7526 [Cymbomonas tetramitiformis]